MPTCSSRPASSRSTASTEALAAVEVLAFLRDPRDSGDPKGGVSVLSASGGAGALLADHSSEFGITMAEFSPATVDKLEGILPDFARKANPIDLTGQINTVPTLFRDTCLAVEADPRTEAVVVQFASSGRRFLEPNAEVFKSLAREMPMILSFIGETIERETQQDVPRGRRAPVRRPVHHDERPVAALQAQAHARVAASAATQSVCRLEPHRVIGRTR